MPGRSIPSSSSSPVLIPARARCILTSHLTPSGKQGTRQHVLPRAQHQHCASLSPSLLVSLAARALCLPLSLWPGACGSLTCCCLARPALPRAVRRGGGACMHLHICSYWVEQGAGGGYRHVGDGATILLPELQRSNAPALLLLPCLFASAFFCFLPSSWMDARALLLFSWKNAGIN